MNFQQTVEDISSYHTMVDVNKPIIMTGETPQVSRSLNVSSITYKSPINMSKLTNSDRRVALEEEED